MGKMDTQFKKKKVNIKKQLEKNNVKLQPTFKKLNKCYTQQKIHKTRDF